MGQHHPLTIARAQAMRMEMDRGLALPSVDSFVEGGFGLVVQS
jgi:hypothetical protein